jgi:hypothetical protein
MTIPGDSWLECPRGSEAVQSMRPCAPGLPGAGAKMRCEMEALGTQLPKVSTDEVVRWIREDREHGH